MSTAPTRALFLARFPALLLVALTTLLVSAAHLQAAQGSDTNYALLLDGGNDYVELDARTLGTPSSITLELWTRIDRSGKLHFLVSNALNDFNDGFGMIVNADNTVAFMVWRGIGNGSVVTSSTALQIGEWYHVSGTYDAGSGQVKLYVNGVQEASDTFTPGIFYHGARRLWFGSQVKWFGRSSRYLAGAVDEVRVWNRVRNPGEIFSTMTYELSGDEPGLIGYWPMNEGQGKQTADAVSSANDGRLQNGPTWIEAPWRVAREIIVAIDLKPDSDRNRVRLSSRGKLPVALLGSSDFDVVEEVDRSSLTFGATGDENSLHRRGYRNTPNCGVEDVNDDELSDLVCKFYTQRAGLAPDVNKVLLKGLTHDGMPIIGEDDVSPISRWTGDDDDDDDDEDHGDDDDDDDDDDDRKTKKRKKVKSGRN